MAQENETFKGISINTVIKELERNNWFTEITDELSIEASKRVRAWNNIWDIKLEISTVYQYIIITTITIENNENYFSVNNYNIRVHTPYYTFEYEERREFLKQFEHIIFNSLNEFKKFLSNDIELLRVLFKAINYFLENQASECKYYVDEIIASL